MQLSTKVIKSSKKVHKCLLCCRDIPKGSIYINNSSTDNTGSVESVKLCIECAYLLNYTTKTTLDEGNFTDIRIPNCLRKIRNEYRKNPKEAWDKQYIKEQFEEVSEED